MPVTWDQAAALERVDGDSDLLTELVEIFVQDYPKHLACLVQALAQNDYAALCRAAHTLKGSLGYLGACEGQQLALEIEHASRAGDAARLRQLVSSLAAYLEALREIISPPSGEHDRAGDHY